MTDLNDGAAADSNAENNSTDVSPVKSANEGIADKAENSVGADVNAAADNAGTAHRYGRMRDEFPGGDPYIFGKPEPEKKKKQKKEEPEQPAMQYIRIEQNDSAENEERQAVQMLPFNPDDPQSNPVYGHWDSYSFAAIILGFLFPPVGIILGCISLYRTRILHMKGKGLAIAAIVVGVIVLVVDLLCIINGITPEQILERYGR